MDMLLALATHISRAEYPLMGPPVVLGALAVFVAWGRARAVPIAPRQRCKEQCVVVDNDGNLGRIGSNMTAPSIARAAPLIGLRDFYDRAAAEETGEHLAVHLRRW